MEGKGGRRQWTTGRGRAAGVRGAAAGVLGGGLARADAGAAARRPCCSGSRTGRGGFIRLYRAKIGGVAEPCHVTGRDSGRRYVRPLPRHHA